MPTSLENQTRQPDQSRRRRAMLCIALATSALLAAPPFSSGASIVPGSELLGAARLAAATPVCQGSGEPFVEILAVQRLSPAITASGRTVRLQVTVAGGVSPLRVGVNYLPDPDDRLSAISIDSIVTGSDTVVIVSGPVPNAEPISPHKIFNVWVTDAADCKSFYYRPGPNQLLFDDPAAANVTTTHTLDLEALALSVVPNNEVPDDPLDPAGWVHDQHYVEALAQVFFGRPATAAEVQQVENTIESSGRLGLTQTLAASEEWAGRVVDDIYGNALDRPAEPAGRIYWSQRLFDGGVTRDIAVSIYGSSEAYARAGGTNDGFVDVLYNRILDRDPGPEGRAFWIDQLESDHAQPVDLVAFFWQSPEFRAQRVESVYQRVLGRSPDAAGHAYWAEQLLTTDDVQLAALLASSDEFYNTAQI